MKTKTLGVAVITLGIMLMIYTGFNYTTSEKVVDIGPIEINKEKNHPIHWSPIIGAIFIVGGIVLLSISKSKNKII